MSRGVRVSAELPLRAIKPLAPRHRVGGAGRGAVSHATLYRLMRG